MERGDEMSSDLKSHRRVKGGLQAPLNAEVGDRLESTGWISDRLPDYLWWDGLVRILGDGAIERGRALNNVVQKAVASASEPPLGFCSDFARVPEPERGRVQEEFQRLFGDSLTVFGGTVHLFEQHPMAWLFEKSAPVPASEAETFLAEQIARLLDRRSTDAAKAQLLVISELARAGKLRFAETPEIKELVRILVEFPNVEDTRGAGGAISAMSISLFGLWHTKTDWPSAFWAQNLSRAPCSVAPEAIETSLDSDIVNGTGGELEANRVIALRRALLLLDSHARTKGVDRDKAEVVLGLASRCVRIAEDVAVNPVLRSGIWLRAGIRMVGECIVNAAYLLKQTPETATRFKEYGRGREKLTYKHLQDLAPAIQRAHRQEFEDIVARLREKANEEIIEIVTDIKWDDWAGTSTRRRAEETGLQKFYNIAVAPAHDDVHCSWGSAKSFDLVRCMNPTHAGHLIPWRRGVFMTYYSVSVVLNPVVDLFLRIGREWGCETELAESLALSRPGEEAEERPDVPPERRPSEASESPERNLEDD